MPRATRPAPETAGNSAPTHQAAAADRSSRRRPASERELAVLPAPDQGRVNAARSQLARRFAAGVDAMLPVTPGRPLLDLRAVSTVLDAAHGGNGHGPDAHAGDGQGPGAHAGNGHGPDAHAGDGRGHGAHAGNGHRPDVHAGDGQVGGGVGVLDLGAALIVLAALRLDIDRLEADLMDEVLRAGLGQEFIASALGIPVPQAMKRHRLLGERRTSPTDGVPRATSPPAAQHP